MPKKKNKKKSQSDKSSSTPWGRTIGLLVACTATMAGAWQGVGLSHLLFRAAVGSLIVCLVVGLFFRLVSAMTPDSDAT